jgi:signal transduction histidine kinase
MYLAEELPLMRALAGETVALDDEIVRNGPTKRDLQLRVSAAPIRDEEDAIVGAVAVVRDVTEISELDRLKDEFISVAAHELKTPVAIVKGHAQLLMRKPDEISEEQSKLLAAINRGSDRIARVVNDLLEISRLLAGPVDLRTESIDLSALVADVAERSKVASAKHRLRVVRNEYAVVQGDRDRLEQVLEHLIHNARKYSPRGGDVDVALDVVGGDAVVSVRDSGVGIPLNKQVHIFERFYRAHTGTPYDYGGMGVGLFICEELIRRQGGKMWFESAEGEGSTFFFKMPCQSPQCRGADQSPLSLGEG